MQHNPNNPCIHLFTTQIAVRWRDIDPFGMVNHSVFFTLMEDARLKWLANTGLQNKLKYVYPIVDAHVTFKSPIFFPADVIIKLFSHTIKKKSWVFYHEIYSSNTPEEIHAKASLISVAYDPELKSSVSIPEEIIEALHKTAS